MSGDTVKTLMGQRKMENMADEGNGRIPEASGRGFWQRLLAEVSGRGFWQRRVNIMTPSRLLVSVWCIATVVGLQFGSSAGCSRYHYGSTYKYDLYCEERTLICKNTSWDLTYYYYDDRCDDNYCYTLQVEDSQQPFITSTTFVPKAKCLSFELILKNNCIQSIAKDTFTNFVKLRVINLDNNELSNLDFIEDLNELRQLSVNSNNLTQLHASNFKKLTELEVLNLAFNKLHSVGNGSFNFYSLQTTGQSNNNSKQIEANVSNLPQLQALNLSSNKLEFIEIHAFKGLNELISLDLSANKLTSLPEETFFDISSLQNLSLQENLFQFISPRVFFPLTSLQDLDLNGNYLENIIANMFNYLKKLKRLDLSNNKISTLTTDSFIGLDNLQQLSLSNNMIVEVPLGCLRGFPKLTTLNLAVNYLTGFKIGSFSNLKELIYLNLSHNKFSAVNEVVLYPLNKLEMLDLDNNNLSFINYTSLLSHLPSLRFISVNDNIWLCAFLTNMLKTFRSVGKDYLFNAPSRYTEENVHGIVCSESETSGEINDSDFGNAAPKTEMHSAVFPNISNDITNFKTYLSNIVSSIKENTSAFMQLLQNYNRSKAVTVSLEGADNTINKYVTITNSRSTDIIIVIILLLCIVMCLLIMYIYIKYVRKVIVNKQLNEKSSVIELLNTSS